MIYIIEKNNLCIILNVKIELKKRISKNNILSIEFFEKLKIDNNSLNQDIFC